MGSGDMPGCGLGTSANWASRGRRTSACSPPPWLAAWARKSASFGGSAVVVRVRMTSRVGITGAGSSRVKATPRISTPKAMADSASVAVRRSGGPIFGPGPTLGPGGSTSSNRSGSTAKPGLDHVEQLPGDVQAELLVQLAGAGRAGHVHLGEPVADHVQAGEDDAAGLELGAHLGG